MAAEFLDELAERLGVDAQAALQATDAEVDAQQAAAQREQRGDAEQSRRVERGSDALAGNEAELPVRVAAAQVERRCIAGLAALK